MSMVQFVEFVQVHTKLQYYSGESKEEVTSSWFFCGQWNNFTRFKWTSLFFRSPTFCMTTLGNFNCFTSYGPSHIGSNLFFLFSVFSNIKSFLFIFSWNTPFCLLDCFSLNVITFFWAMWWLYCSLYFMTLTISS